MVVKELLDSLKAFKISTMGKDHVSSTFPILLANVCRSMSAINMYGEHSPILYDWGKFIEFQINLGNAIATNQFDTIDNIIIEFFKEYNYKIVTPKGQLVMFKIMFPKDAETRFETICNSFKEKDWDSILDEFIDALYEFLSSAKIHGDDLVPWH